MKRFYKGLLLVGLLGAGAGLVGCADEYAAYPGYRGGYYASSYGGTPYPSYGYGYPYGAYGYPYRAYGPYYGGYPSYGGASVVISGSRNSYTYRDRFGRVHTSRDVRRPRSNSARRSRIQTQSTEVRRSDSDDERRYYSRP